MATEYLVRDSIKRPYMQNVPQTTIFNNDQQVGFWS